MARVSEKDLKESTSPTKAKVAIKETATPFKAPPKTEIYDKTGSAKDVLPEDQIMAKFTVKGNTQAYTVRVNRRNALYNPYDKSYNEDSYRLARIEGTTPFSMAIASKETFELYLKFLRGKNPSYLDQAQRGI